MAIRDMSERKLILITIAVAAAFVLPCWGAFYFVWKGYSDAQTQYAQANTDKANKEKQLKEEEKNAKRIGFAQAEYEVEKKMLPDSDQVSNFFRDDLPNLLAANNFQFQSLSMKPPTREHLPGKVNIPVYSREIEIHITGTYKDMIRLLKEIEEGRESTGEEGKDNGSYRLFKVKDFDFQPSGAKTLDPDLKHGAKLTLLAYYIDENGK
ncbi:MAG: hypothetical protein ACREJ2_14165 [Planctomycetota bacterium]